MSDRTLGTAPSFNQNEPLSGASLVAGFLSAAPPEILEVSRQSHMEFPLCGKVQMN